MKQITKDNFSGSCFFAKTAFFRRKLFWAAAFFAMLPFVSAQAEIYSRIALYEDARYPENFERFSYTDAAAVKGGRVVMPEYGGFDSFNPFIFKGIPATQPVLLTLDSLGFSPADDPSVAYPLIAEKFELPADKSYVGFIIDSRARFHDGQPVTADDVIFSYNALIEKGAPLYKIYYGDVERVEKVNERHVRFYFKKGTKNRELPLILSQLQIFSAGDWDGKDFGRPTLRPPLGSGPYKIKDFRPGKFVELERVADYWAADIPSRRGFYNFDEIRFDYYQDTTVTLQALFAGNIDIREEYIAKIWVTGYNNEVVRKGKVVKEELTHNNPAVLQNFAFNLRRGKFQDRRVREAIGLAFNFDWANDRLFYNQYERLYSYFTNTGMEAVGLPAGRELEILNRYKKQLTEDVFARPFKNPRHRDFKDTRQNLRRAVQLLQSAGYDFADGRMTNVKTGEPLEFEVLSNSANGSSFTRVMLPFIENLRKIGIKAEFRNLETNIFKNRLDNFDFDMAIISYGISSMPGTEQQEMWGSASADAKGSYNIIGIKNPVVDALIEGLIRAENKNDYQAYVKALDRVLLHGHYLIFQWFSPVQRVAYRNKFAHPSSGEKVGFQPHTWWIKQERREKGKK